MPSVVDSGTMLIPAGLISTTQDFPAILAYPRQLATCHWVTSMLIPPSAAATFTLAVSSIKNGTYSTIATLGWPAGLSGSRQVPVGVQGNMAQFRNNQALWVRASIDLT